MTKNNDYLMNVDNLGRLYMKDIIIFYDEPLLFSCVNDLCNYFLVNCIDMDEDKKEWLALPISEARLIRGLKGNISGYTLFKEPEGEFLWEVIQYKDKTLCDSKRIIPEELSDDDLPDKDVFFNIYKDKLLNNYDNNILRESIKERREILDVSLEPNGSHVHEIDADILGKVLSGIQNMVNVIAHKKGVNSKVPNNIKENNKLNVSGNYAASFGIRLKSNNLSNILNESEIQENLDIFMDILESKSDTKKLIEIFKNLNPSVSIQYKNLLKIFNKEEINFKTYCAFPSKKYRTTSFRRDEIINSIKSLEEVVKEVKNIVELDGEIVAIDTLNKTFRINTSNNERIHGIIGEDINIEEYVLPKYAKIKLEVLSKLNDLTGKENINYKLLELKYE
ncbi:DUF6575 domain-containing protein [Clostridium tyrobutyricum]|uniref:DUF6575 domain-containing protein n=1 Tax=Clostridium tyrobutyricum TaxID=1519 RepID=UPI001C391E4E|nr:DUF6575 domain-containing protein [Clostridium tyrobutyricum]MBV4422384.1 hypothetical protein [Clostridium tyrobutyricum]